MSQIHKIKLHHNTETAQTLISGALRVVNNCQTTLNHISQEDFCHRPANTDWSIGEQMRHIIDHFTILIQADPAQPIDYVNRARSPDLETSKDLALQSLNEIQESIAQLTPTQIEASISVIDVLDDTKEPVIMPTSFGRELAYVSQHGTHHLAMLEERCRRVDISLPKDLGKAPSTLQYEKDGC